MRELGLIRRAPTQPLPPTPAAAAAALFLCTHDRLGADCLISQLDAGLLADILDCYAREYAQLDFAEQSNTPWTCAFVTHGLEMSAQKGSLSLQLQAASEAHGESLESRRRRGRSRVLHLPGPAWSTAQSVTRSGCASGGGRGRAASVAAIKDGARAGDFTHTSTMTDT